ncbi:MAG TPA: tryptophan synthase subunit alpha [Polyangiaceae bacterium]|nr:tryptophan synthase subunit alpha [Polyangiaceae bacterium]
MNRLDATFARGHKVLVAYLCVGDPSVAESVELALACARAGADVLELGVPFSDPTADGPAIAQASQRAIAAGGGLEASLRAARAVRAAEPDVGIVLFGYYNPLFVHGEERVAREAAEAGVDALLVVDLPVEEGTTLRAAACQRGVGVVPLLAPTSKADRIAAAKASAVDGYVPFVYYVSLTGVTGSAALDAKEAGVRAGRLRSEVGRPVVVGFGIDSGAKARAAAQTADGVAVGTALVRAIEAGRNPRDRRHAVERLVHELRKGVDATGPT